jgi:hypothetical protein
MPQERASQQAAWYDDQPFTIGDRVQIVDAAERSRQQGDAGRVVGYDASGPHRGEDFIRVLVLVDGPEPAIAAIPPACLEREADASERTGLAKTMLIQFRQSLGDERFAKLQDWLQSEACQKLLDDPRLTVKNIRLGALTIPGILLPEMARLVAQDQKNDT